MELFDVYNLWPIEPIKGEGSTLWDSEGVEYLDLYGGHAVISIGHNHPHFVKRVSQQLNRLPFYSNSVINPLQKRVAEELESLSGYKGYHLFLSNSGAEAVENGLKIASFHTGSSEVIAFKGAFHGRTSGAVAVSDNPSIVSPFNSNHRVTFLELNKIERVIEELSKKSFAAIIVEGIQGVAGVELPSKKFLQELREECSKREIPLIVDEIQSGYGRSGTFFAHQQAEIKADIVTVAKGMGNGFPIGGTIIAPHFRAKKGLLGSTFGGNHLASAAALAVLEVIKREELVREAAEKGEFLLKRLKELQTTIGKEVIVDIRGRGLMMGVELNPIYSSVREALLFNEKIFTGLSKESIIRILPPLTISYQQLERFLKAFERELLAKKLNLIEK